MRKLLLLFIIFISNQCVWADTDNNNKVFYALFNDWTNAFNHQNLTKSCDLFSKKVIANYQGVRKKSYSEICDGFKKIFEQNHKQYRYRFIIREIYRENNLAAVRITWYLTIHEKGKLIDQVQDEGIDVLQKDKNEHWKIVNYLAFPCRK